MKRRGIGNVVASAVMVFLLIFTVSQLYIYNLNQLDNYNQVAQGVFNTNAQKQNEQIRISNVVVNPSSGTTKVDVTVTNAGGVTSHIVSVWMVDVVFGTSPHVRVLQNTYIGPGLSTTFANLDTGVISSLNHQILIKVYTELGNSASIQLLPPGLGGTSSLTTATTQLTLIPPNPITSNDIVVLLTVTNTNALGVAFTSLTPDMCIVQGSVQPVFSTLDSGTATVLGTTTTLTDSTKSWGVNQWVDNLVYITAGTGVGETGRIVSNTNNVLTVSAASGWTVAPDTTSTYVIRSDCHGSKPTLDSGTATLVGLNTLTDSSKSWITNQWVNYMVTITSGTGAVQTGTVTSNTGSQLTVSANWSPSLATGAKYSIRISNCGTGTGGTTTAPVYCEKVQGPTPTSLTFLPPGGSIQFQWIYLVTSIIPDSSITFAASYVNTTTTIGMITSPPSMNQIPSQTATIRQVGGASAQTGGGISSILGSLTIDITSFQYAKVNAGAVCWKTGFQPKGGDTTVFRVKMTNIGSTTITLNQNSEFVDLQAASGGGGQLQPTEWFIALDATVSGGVIHPVAMPGGGGVTLTPGQTIAVHFGSITQNSANSASLPASGNRLFTFMILLGTQTGSIPNFGQSIPFVGLTTTSSDPAGCFGTY